MSDFEAFAKIPRLSREVVVTEKIDGTNAQVCITEEGTLLAGSRSRWVTPGKEDNFGFAAWVTENRDELLRLGPGRHFGEWWGLGIQRGYGQNSKRFSLFNTSKWADESVRPSCCSVVPVLYSGAFDTVAIEEVVASLRSAGSVAAPGFMKPEGVAIYHTALGGYFKKTVDKDHEYKSKEAV